MYEKKPWISHLGDIPETIPYPRMTMYQAVKRSADLYPDYIAYDFMGTKVTFKEFLADIDRCANAFATSGLRKGDRVTIALPNTPHAVISFYALNKLGAIASMIHPLSAPKEIEFYLNLSNSIWAITLDAFYGKFKEIIASTGVTRILLARISDYLSPLKRIGFRLTAGRKIPRVPDDPMIIWWKELLNMPSHEAEPADLNPDELAVILYSGGTTGTPKGVMLSSMNFSCLALQTVAVGPHKPGESMVTVLPVFHGFGLGACVHSVLVDGGECILVPRFSAGTVASIFKSKRPRLIAGVPTLYEALISNHRFRTIDLSCLNVAVSGGDVLPTKVKKRFDELVRANRGTVKLREGYGLAETIGVCVLTPRTEQREESIGIPFPDTMAKVVKLGTEEEAPPGEEGEICISGPTVMLGYLDNPEETAKVLRKHADGGVWCHTGDIGIMDKDGFMYFKHRLKRMIKVSGVSVYPTQIEACLNSHPDVSLSCAIGVPDEYQVQRIKAFVVLVDPSKAGPEMEQKLKEHCRRQLIVWSCPKEIEFRRELPKTLIGKIAYRALEEQELERLRIPKMEVTLTELAQHARATEK